MKDKIPRLQLSERVVIQTLLKENRTITYIAAQLDRNKSSISREVQKWVKKPTDTKKQTLISNFNLN